MLIDTHCHLQDEKAFPDVGAALHAAEEAGAERVIVVGTQPLDWEKAIELADRFERAYAIVGWHPNYTSGFSAESMKVLEEHLAHPKVLACGEIGLDYHWDYAPRERQFEALAAGLDLAARLDKPVVFHAREAYGDLLDVLESRPAHDYLFHCWAGDREEARRAVALGAYFGVDGPVTYPKAEPLREVLREIPTDRLVIETDSPYMAPHPFRGKPNQPAYVRYVNDGLAKTLGIEFDECARMTSANARRFFRF
jgi:TatD DNase family protein